MKLTAPEVRIINNSECSWDTAMKMLRPIKQVFPSCRVTAIVPHELDDHPVTTVAQMQYYADVGQYVYSAKAGAPLKKKPKRDQMSLSLISKSDGLKER